MTLNETPKRHPDCGGGWDLTDEHHGEWHCADCGAKSPEQCPLEEEAGSSKVTER